MSRNKIQFGRPKTSSSKNEDINLHINNLTLDGRGVAKHAGKTVFVEGAIPNETVTVKIKTQHKRFDEAHIVSIDNASADRVEANCAHFTQCGGCQLQHIETKAQLAFKQSAVLSLLEHNAKTTPNTIADPLRSSAQHYRRSARIGVNRLFQSDSAIVGFRRKGSSKLLQISQCDVLPAHLSSLFDQLRETLDQIDNAKAITHIEYLQGDDKGALTLRCKATLTAQSCDLISQVLKTFNLLGFLRYDDALVAINDESKPALNIESMTDSSLETALYYSVDDIKLYFKPGDFLQVNAAVNRQLIERAIQWLALSKEDNLLDLFAGLGNFSLAMAKQTNHVIGVEGSEEMVKRAIFNADTNHISNCDFFSADLSKEIAHQPWAKSSYNKIILDPPRNGATELIKNLLAPSDDTDQPKNAISHILYVACDPSSLARDTELLSEFGYTMDKFCVMDMFPDTTHIESMALFIKDDAKPKRSSTVSKTNKSTAAKLKKMIKF